MAEIISSFVIPVAGLAPGKSGNAATGFGRCQCYALLLFICPFHLMKVKDMFLKQSLEEKRAETTRVVSTFALRERPQSDQMNKGILRPGYG